MLSNIFQHHAPDKWFEEMARPRLRGTCQLVRFADDFVVALEDRHSGKRLLDVLGKRLGRYGLTLHEAKTRYVDFRRTRPYGLHWMASATTFDFLGFTHVLGRSMQGKVVVRQITVKGRFARALKSVHKWCKKYRHLPSAAQQEHLARVIWGHCAYYGLTGNDKRLRWFRYQVARIWWKWLARRSRLRRMNWDRMSELLKRYPPAASHDHALTAKLLERTCQLRNRVHQSRTFGSVGAGRSNAPAYPAPPPPTPAR